MQRQSRHNKFMSPVLYFFVKHKNIQQRPENKGKRMKCIKIFCGPPRRITKQKQEMTLRDYICCVFFIFSFFGGKYSAISLFFYHVSCSCASSPNLHYQIITKEWKRIVALKFWSRREQFFFLLSSFLFCFMARNLERYLKRSS